MMYTKCQDGYQSYYDKDGIYCRKSMDSNCLMSNGDQCILCQVDLYPEGLSCVIDKFQQYSLTVNEFTYFTQTKPSLAAFRDGTVMVVWESNYQDGFNWGVYGQVLDSQRQKKGNNFQVSQTTQGNQHSAYIQILEDDTAIILYIDGNLEQGALLKIARFNKDQQRIGDDLDIDIIKLEKQRLNNDYIAKVIKLKNGGYVIAYITITGVLQQKVLKLKFYNSENQQVQQIQVQDYFYQKILISSTDQNVAIIYRGQVRTFSLDGTLLISQEQTELNNIFIQQLSLSSNSQYFVIAFVTSENNIIKANVQFYDQNFMPYGNQIFIKESIQNGNGLNNQIQLTQIDEYNEGISLMIEQFKNGISGEQEQYYINSNMEIKFINRYHIQNNRFDYSSNCMKIAHLVDNSIFVIWVKFQVFNALDYSNIQIQKITAQGEYSTQMAVQCSYGCLQCSSNYQCTECRENYQKNYDNCSPICQQNCKSCIIPTVCNQCEEGYFEEIQGICTPLKSDYHQPQLLITQEIQGNIQELISTSNGTICFLSIYYSQINKLQYLNIYVIQDQQIIMKVTIEKSNFYAGTTYIYKIEQEYVIVCYDYQKLEVFKIGQDQQIILDKVIDLREHFLELSLNLNQMYLEPLINHQYSLTFIKNSYDKMMQTTMYNIMLDSELNLIGEPQIIKQLEGTFIKEKENNYYKFYGINGTALLIGDQLIWKICPYSQVLQYPSCDVFALKNGNQIQIFAETDNYYGFMMKIIQSITYRLLNSEFIPITQEMKVTERRLETQELLKVLTFSNTFAIILKQSNSYNERFQLVIQYFENSGAKLGSQIYIGIYEQYQIFTKFIQSENGFKIYWQSQQQYCTQIECFVIKNIIQYKEYDDQGNEITNGLNTKCMQNCDECINERYCQKCSPNYNLNSISQCVIQCPQNCISCSTVQCDICQNGYELLSNLKQEQQQR